MNYFEDIMINALLEYWDFCGKNIDEACDFLDWFAWDTHKFESGCSDSYIPPHCIPTHAPHVGRICLLLIMTTRVVPIIFWMTTLLDLVV